MVTAHSLCQCENTCVYSFIFTAHNEVGARLFFHRRVWFCSRGGGVCLSACWDTTPLTRHPPPRSRPPPGAEHARRYGQCVGGTHPTGMQSCCHLRLLMGNIFSCVCLSLFRLWLLNHLNSQLNCLACRCISMFKYQLYLVRLGSYQKEKSYLT